MKIKRVHFKHDCPDCTEVAEPLPDPGVNTRGALRRNPHDTEVWAADGVAEVSGRQRIAVRDYIWDCGSRGSTDHEGENAMGLERSSFSTRRGELVKMGWVVDSGRKRPTNTSKLAIVWTLSPQGVDEMRA